jgi:hypothetical protein
VSPLSAIYIPPSASIHSSFADAGGAIDQGGLRLRARDDERFDLPSLAQGRRTLIVGEPGVGKTVMMERLAECLQGVAASRIPLRKLDALDRINAAVSLAADGSRHALFLDGLDEVPSRLLPETLQKITEVSQMHADMPIFVSGRWVFVKRYAAHFSDFRLATIHPFSIRQVREYLWASGHGKRDIDALLQRVQFGHRTLILQIPRYLYYLASYIKERGVDAAVKLSRNGLFEHFIYRKLDLEDQKLNADKKALVKRLLEKLALVMEIYQANVITMDELMTFFEELKSDLKLTALSQVELEVFYDCSLLRVSQGEFDKMEFENTEFQEYLAAKEISRFADPNRTAFGFAVDVDANEIRPTWYNALTFLVDLQPSLLQPIMEFSGLLRAEHKVIDEGFFTFLGRLDPNAITSEFRVMLFRLVIDYHARTLQWVPTRLAGALPALFHSSLESHLRGCTADAEPERGARRYIPLANIAEVVGTLLREGVPLDKPFWRKKLIAYATDDNDNGVLQRHALSALGNLGDPTVIDELRAVSRRDELVAEALIDAFIELDPDHPATLQLIFDGVRRNDISARRGLYGLQKIDSVKALLSLATDDEEFRNGFLEGLSIFGEADVAIADVVRNVLNDEICDLAKGALVAMLQRESAHHVERSVFLLAFWKVLSVCDPNFAAEMVRRIKVSRNGASSFFYARHLFISALEERDVGPFLAAMRAAGDEQGAIDVMNAIKRSERPNAAAIYEASRAHAPDTYKHLEATLAVDESLASRQRSKEKLTEFRSRLEPEPGKFREDVFDYYNQHAAELDPLIEEGDRARLRELIVGTVFKFENPGTHKLKITNEGNGATSYTISSAVRLYKQAAATALRLGVDVTLYRPRILSLIPFADGAQMRTIFGLVPQATAGELDHVLDVYIHRDSDLWRHRPANLVEAVKRYHVVKAVPVLKALVNDTAIESHAREQALGVADSLAPDAVFLQDVFERYRGSDKERHLAEIANALLITSHADRAAVHWRLAQLEARAAPIEKRKRKRARALSSLEGEVSFEKTFAQPLMLLSQRGYEVDFLRLLEKATIFWGGGVTSHAYAEYLWDIIYAYFDNLKESRSYEPLRMLEVTMTGLKDREGANWLAGKMVALRRGYLEHIGRPKGIGDAVDRYNKARQYNVESIRDSSDLFHHLKDAIDTDLRRWIEGEGAYRLLVLESKDRGKRLNHEELIQKTVKAQVENALLRRGFQVDIVREPQLLDDKRVDFLVRYGFAGPVVVEVKLTSNTDLRARRLDDTRSYRSMKRYIDGYGAPYGIFLVIDNTKARNLADVRHAYEQIPRVHVQTLDCTVGAGRAEVRRAGVIKRRSRRPNAR